MSAATKTSNRFRVPAEARLEPAVVRELSRLRPLRSVAAIAGDWALLLGAGALCWKFWHPALYPVAVAFIGARQHDLMLLVHDAAHYRLFKNKTLNDWVGDLFLAWPFVLTTLGQYRENHHAHHRHLNTDDDPDFARKQGPHWEFPMPASRLAWLLLTEPIGLGFARLFRTTRTVASGAKKKARAPLARLLYLALILLTIHLTGMWIPFLLFWVVPFLTWTQLAMRMRSIAEHHALPESALGGTRTVRPGLLDRLFIMGHNGWLHLEHHLYPSVPFYNLGRLHAHLMARPEFRRRAHVSEGYAAVVQECLVHGRAASSRQAVAPVSVTT